MSSTSIGREAENLVAEHLRKQGHKIVVQNWKTRWCEVDVISIHKKTIFFTEVKYRTNQMFGGGLEYITPKKLEQIKFAANFWLHENKWTGGVCLLAAEVDSRKNVNLIEL